MTTTRKWSSAIRQRAVKRPDASPESDEGMERAGNEELIGRRRSGLDERADSRPVD
jgi:hypothetical protein